MALPSTELLTAREVALLARVSRATVYTWARDHKLASHTVNGRLRFRRDDVLTYLGLEEQAS